MQNSDVVDVDEYWCWSAVEDRDLMNILLARQVVALIEEKPWTKFSAVISGFQF